MSIAIGVELANENAVPLADRSHFLGAGFVLSCLALLIAESEHLNAG
jgi:hypothetical protein